MVLREPAKWFAPGAVRDDPGHAPGVVGDDPGNAPVTPFWVLIVIVGQRRPTHQAGRRGCQLQGPLRDRRRHVKARADPRRVRRRGRWLVGAAGGMRVQVHVCLSRVWCGSCDRYEIVPRPLLPCYCRYCRYCRYLPGSVVLSLEVLRDDPAKR